MIPVVRGRKAAPVLPSAPARRGPAMADVAPSPQAAPPPPPTCTLTERLSTGAIVAAANIATALVVGTLVFNKKRNGWILPALAGGVSGQVAGIATNAFITHVRAKQC